MLRVREKLDILMGIGNIAGENFLFGGFLMRSDFEHSKFFQS